MPIYNVNNREFEGLKTCAVRARGFMFSSQNSAPLFDYEETIYIRQCHPNVAPVSHSSIRGITKKSKISLLRLLFLKIVWATHWFRCTLVPVRNTNNRPWRTVNNGGYLASVMLVTMNTLYTGVMSKGENYRDFPRVSVWEISVPYRTSAVSVFWMTFHVLKKSGRLLRSRYSLCSSVFQSMGKSSIFQRSLVST